MVNQASTDNVEASYPEYAPCDIEGSCGSRSSLRRSAWIVIRFIKFTDYIYTYKVKLLESLLLLSEFPQVRQSGSCKIERDGQQGGKMVYPLVVKQ